MSSSVEEEEGKDTQVVVRCSPLHGKMTIQEEQIADYTEKITALEEELKNVTELFTVQKAKIEKFQAILQAREMELEVEDTQEDSDITKVLLAKEEYVASTLESSEDQLHGTATKLLTTVEETTGDVSGLHAKLDRKKAVEQHNVEAQRSFMEHMNAHFDQIQSSVRKNCQNQQEMLNSYTSSVNDLLNTSLSTFGVTAAAIDAAFTSVKEIVSTEVSLAAEKMLTQDTLTSKNKNDLQKMMEEHACGLDKALSSLTPVVQLVQSINSQLQEHFKKNSSLAEMARGKEETVLLANALRFLQLLCLQGKGGEPKAERLSVLGTSNCLVQDKITGYKEELSAFFHDHSLDLSKLHKNCSQMFTQLQDSYESLQEEVELTKMAQKTNTAQLIASLQNQLTVFDNQAQQNFSQLLEKGGSLKKNINDVQENIIVQTIGLVNSANSQQNKMIPALDDLSQEIKQSSHDNVKILLESDNYCKNLSSSLRKTCKEATSWAETATAEIGCVVDQQKAFLNSQNEHLQNMYKGLHDKCNASEANVTDYMKRQKEAEYVALRRLLDHLENDREVLTEQKDLLLEEAEDGLIQINGLLTEDLKTDPPTA